MRHIENWYKNNCWIRFIHTIVCPPNSFALASFLSSFCKYLIFLFPLLYTLLFIAGSRIHDILSVLLSNVGMISTCSPCWWPFNMMLIFLLAHNVIWLKNHPRLYVSPRRCESFWKLRLNLSKCPSSYVNTIQPLINGMYPSLTMNLFCTALCIPYNNNWPPL